MIAWEVITRKRPYSGQNRGLIELMYDVCHGTRPTFPETLEDHVDINLDPYVIKQLYSEYISLTEKCWNADPKRRPDIRDVVMTTNEFLLVAEQ